MINKDDLQKKAQETRDELIELHQKSGLPGKPIDFTQYQPAIDLCDAVIESVPEFKEYKDYPLWGKENPYLHFGVFGDFLVNQIEQTTDSDPVVKKAFNFVNGIYNSSRDEQLRTMFGTEIFEKLTASDKTVDAAKKNLTGEALNSFSKTHS